MSDYVAFDLMKCLIPCQNCVKKRHDGDFLIVSSIQQEIYYLNDTARCFYELCDGETSIEQIVLKMMEEYEVDRQVMEKDAVELIRNFQWQDIIGLRRLA